MNNQIEKSNLIRKNLMKILIKIYKMKNNIYLKKKKKHQHVKKYIATKKLIN